ncbi:MAG: MATE family efflux transporter [Eubacterium sp.]
MQEEKEINKMGVEPVKKLLITMGIPMIISMALQAVYNIVDSYFVSCMRDTETIKNMGDYAVNALTLSFPIQMLMVAIGVGTGVGVNAVLSKSLGKGDREKASKIAGNAVFLGICTYIIFLVFCFLGVDIYMKSQTSDPIILSLGNKYLKICTAASIGISMYMTYEKLLQATGKTMLSTIAQITGALTNIVLDPILIFGYLGFPQMGIAGAAYATVIGQCVSFILDAIFHYKLNNDVDSGFKYLKPDLQIIKEIFEVGIPAIIMQALMSFMTYGVNIILGGISTAAVTAYGVYYKIQQFVFFAAFGMNNAMIPVIGFCYGMGNKKRVKDGIRYGIIYTVVIMLVGMLLLQTFAVNIVGIFSVSDETRKLCILAIRIITPGYLFAGANIAFQGIFQALGCGIKSLVISMLRLLIIALPLAWIFTQFSNAKDIVWLAFPISEGVAMISACVFMKIVSDKKIKPMKAL